jgi:hypothetical protein
MLLSQPLTFYSVSLPLVLGSLRLTPDITEAPSMSGTLSVQLCELLFGVMTGGGRLPEPLAPLVESVWIRPASIRPR